MNDYKQIFKRYKDLKSDINGQVAKIYRKDRDGQWELIRPIYAENKQYWLDIIANNDPNGEYKIE